MRDADGQSAAWLTDGLSDAEVPNTALLERQVIYGGASRLREQVRNAMRVLAGELYLIVPGCAAEMIGDDVNFIVREMRQSGDPVLKVDTAGYRGTAPDGYAQFAVDVLAYIHEAGLAAESSEKRPVVNIWGVLPGVDPYWEGGLEELTELLEATRFRVTRLFGFGSGLSEWRLAPSAVLNIAISPWGVKPARWAQQTFGAPVLELPGLPAGPEQEKEMLMALRVPLGLDEDVLHARALERKLRFLHALGHVSSDYVRYGFQMSFAVVTESSRAFSLLRFLTETVGLPPKALVLTDLTAKTVPTSMRSYCETHSVALLASDDGVEIEHTLRQAAPNVILGSVLESRVAQKTGALLLEVAYPILRPVILNSGSTGCRGTLCLLERLFEQLKTRSTQERDSMSALSMV